MSMRILGVGTDIIECLRIAQLIERHGELFLRRVFTEGEVDYCSTKKAATQHYAGRWAAKEAVLKALGTGWVRGIGWRDVEVCHRPGGGPRALLHGGAREVAQRQGIETVHLTISHCRTYATAYAIAEGALDDDE